MTYEVGKVQEGYVYDPYGGVTGMKSGSSGEVTWSPAEVAQEESKSSVGNPLQYTARRMDPESGLYQYRARYYSTDRGRIVSADPIGAWGDSGNLGSAYAYVGDSPYDVTDPSGMAPYEVWRCTNGPCQGWEVSQFRSNCDGLKGRLEGPYHNNAKSHVACWYNKPQPQTQQQQQPQTSSQPKKPEQKPKPEPTPTPSEPEPEVQPKKSSPPPPPPPPPVPRAPAKKAGLFAKFNSFSDAWDKTNLQYRG